MNIMTKLFTGTLLCLGLLLAACDPSELSGTEKNTNESTLSPLVSNSNIGTATIEYELVNLGSLGGSENNATSINNAGQVVGYSQIAPFQYHAFVWDKAGGMQDLGTFGGNYSYAYSINDAGQIVGASSTVYEYRAFLWDEAEGMRDLGTLGGDASFAQGINNAGQVVGYSETASGQTHPFLWDEAGGMKDLDPLGGFNSRAMDINDAGQVIGFRITNASQSSSFVWDEASGMHDLGSLGGDFSQARAQAINNAGQVVGYSLTANGVGTQAFLWDEAGGMRDLGTLGGLKSWAYDINDAGEVVGKIQHAWGRTTIFIWDEEGGMRDLGNMGGTSIQAFGINNAGQVVGGNGFQTALLWNPVQNSDTTPPEIAFETETTSLWPPNHKMHLVLSGISATDESDENPSVSVTVASNELLNGLGDGNTAEDWQIEQAADGSFQVYLRAERSGTGSGRIYTVTITAEDASGNVADEHIEVSVAHDLNRSK